MNRRPLRSVLLCGMTSVVIWASHAQAQVLDQVPSNAVAVLKIKSLEGASSKIAKLAAAWGLDQNVPELKDPLGSLMDKGQITQGIDKSGEAAVVYLEPASGAKPDESIVVLMPVTDYTAFVGNFKDGKATGNITKAHMPDGDGDAYIVHWGKYAAFSQSEASVNQKPTGIKLSALAAKESAKRDMLVYTNVAVWGPKATEQLEAQRKVVADQINNGLADEQTKKYAPVAQLVATKYIDAIEEFVADTTSLVVGVDLAEEGISVSELAEFKAASKLGTYASRLESKAAGKLLAGLPMRKYFAFGGSSFDPKVISDIYSENIVPLAKQLTAQGPEGKQIADALTANAGLIGKTTGMTFGMVAPTGGLGQESILQSVALIHGDAESLFKAQRESMKHVGDTLKGAAVNGAPAMDFEYTENAKTISGVALDSYSINIKADANDPKAAQAQQIIGMIGGPNGLGGSFGVASPDTLIAASGASDKLLAELIASAKSPQDNLGTMAGVKLVSGHLAANRGAEAYLQLDNVVGSIVRYAAGFGFPIKVKLPPNLPPIGMSIATEGPTARVDVFVPSSLVQSLISAGIEAYTNFQGGGNNAGGPGGL